MLTLGGRVIGIKDVNRALRHNVLKVTSSSDHSNVSPERSAFLVREDNPPIGFAVYLMLDDASEKCLYTQSHAPIIILPRAYEYLGDGDLVAFSPDKRRIRVLYRPYF